MPNLGYAVMVLKNNSWEITRWADVEDGNFEVGTKDQAAKGITVARGCYPNETYAIAKLTTEVEAE